MLSNSKDIKQDLYTTRDLYFASLLYALEIKLKNVKREGKVCWFNFADKDKCEEIYLSFIEKDISVNAKKYEEAIRTLKDLIFV